ncbi:MAG: hypothetical protein H6Q89_809 [Myxococcaceae bacterium]|nr:hypothetical protein [Myxococcaceae bacterium]
MLHLRNRTRLAVVATLWCSAAFAANVSVDARYDRAPISPDIYGLVLGDDAQVSRMGVTVRRHGGNTLSRYNWKTSTTNTGGDGKFFRTVPQEKGNASNSADNFVQVNKAANARSMIEVPSIGYVTQPLSASSKCGFKVSKYGPQQQVSPQDPECGNGVKPDGSLISGNDPLDTSIPATQAWSTEWVAHLVATFGTAANGGVRFYNLSNQPALWHETHRDIHPARATYAEVKAALEKHGKAVKDADPSALTLGPAAWGWLEYFDSAANDRASAGVDFIPFYLQQAKGYEAANNRRILDYLDVHVYPQAEGVALDAGTAPSANEMRLRSTRILWDPSYTVESWEACCYGGVINLIPRMKEWVARYYPGTKLAISGYAWGLIDSPSGALAQVDVLGIFGREGLDLATLEDPPAPNGLGEDAFKLYRNYDGAGSKFGDTSIRARSGEPLLATFAAFDSARVTTVLVNKSPSAPNPATITFTGMGQSGPYRAFQFSAGGRLRPAGAGSVTNGALTISLPPYSATLVEFVPEGGVGAAEIDPDAGNTPNPDGGTVVYPPDDPDGCNCSQVHLGVLSFAALALFGLLRRRRTSR